MKNSFHWVGLFALVAGLFAALSNVNIVPQAYAHSGATGIVKERMDGMKAIAKATKSIAKLDWKNQSAAREKLRQSANELALHASQIVALFPKGSIKGPSEATPAIWNKPDVFTALAKKLETSANELVDLSDSASSKASVKPAFDRVAATCKSCHGGFRVKK